MSALPCCCSKEGDVRSSGNTAVRPNPPHLVAFYLFFPPSRNNGKIWKLNIEVHHSFHSYAGRERLSVCKYWIMYKGQPHRSESANRLVNPPSFIHFLAFNSDTARRQREPAPNRLTHLLNQNHVNCFILSHAPLEYQLDLQPIQLAMKKLTHWIN